MNENGSREPEYYFTGLNNSGGVVNFGVIATSGLDAVSILFSTTKHQTFTPLYTDEGSTVWASRNGVTPLSVRHSFIFNSRLQTPRCGFSGNSCPLSFTEAYLVYVIIGVVIVFIAMLIAAIGIGFTVMFAFFLNTTLQVKNPRKRTTEHALANSIPHAYQALAQG